MGMSNTVTINASGKATVTEMPAFCGCFSDCFECHKACCAPAIAVGEIAEGTDQSGCGRCCMFTCVGFMCSPMVANCVHGCSTAKKLREQHGLEASGYKLACAHWCCGTCAKTQELRLVKMVREAKEAALTQQAPVRQTMAGYPQHCGPPDHGRLPTTLRPARPWP